MEKSAKAFRTIGEVATWLDTEAYVLRFWESRFSQIKPVKRKDGRRYYRPEDMKVIGGIKTLLHGEGLTIKGVQKILKEKGALHVASLSPPIDKFVQASETQERVEKPLKTKDLILTELNTDPSNIKSSEDVDNMNNMLEAQKTQEKLTEQEELKMIAKRLKILRDMIQEENENSFDV
jgi:DNA-binding transcriptional MerR regulator